MSYSLIIVAHVRPSLKKRNQPSLAPIVFIVLLACPKPSSNRSQATDDPSQERPKSDEAHWNCEQCQQVLIQMQDMPLVFPLWLLVDDTKYSLDTLIFLPSNLQKESLTPDDPLTKTNCTITSLHDSK